MNGAKAESDMYDIETEVSESAEAYALRVVRNRRILLCSVAAIAAAILFSICIGTVKHPVSEILTSLFTFDFKSYVGSTVWLSRMPRAVAAILVGAGLAVSGTVMQSILRNPMASSYTLGISSAAAFGAAFAIIFLTGGTVRYIGIAFTHPFTVTISAMVFCMIATGAILLLSKYAGVTAETMVLAGIAISAIFSAGLTLMQYMADSVQLSNIVAWTFGSLGSVSWMWNFILMFALIPATLYFMSNRWTFNAIDAGDDVARGLGINTGRFRTAAMVAASMLAAMMVVGFGIIAFVGLIAPHIARMVVGGDHRFLIPVSMLFGSILLLLADTAARTMFSPLVLPVGILTALLGGPLFIYLILKKRVKA